MSTTTPRTRRVRTVLATVAVAALAVPGVAVASHVFDDVSDSQFYANAVSWAKDNGITSGCNPSEGNTRFCPDDTVTRGVMAIFLRNLAESQAVDAGTLQGNTASAFLGATAKAADADKLDGVDSSQLRHLSLSVYGMHLENGAATDTGAFGNAGIELPDSGNPSFATSFTLPPDYTSGDSLTLRMTLYHENATGACSFSLRRNGISIGRIGQAFPGGSSTAGISGSEVVNISQGDVLQRVTFTIDPSGTALQAGDSLNVGFFRSSGNASDTCTGVLMIHGAEILY